MIRNLLAFIGAGTLLLVGVALVITYPHYQLVTDKSWMSKARMAEAIARLDQAMIEDGNIWDARAKAFALRTRDALHETLGGASRATTKLAYFHPKRADRIVYVREHKGFKPPAGAPLFYAPWPNTICMLGVDSHGEYSPIYEAKPGVCHTAARGLLGSAPFISARKEQK